MKKSRCLPAPGDCPGKPGHRFRSIRVTRTAVSEALSRSVVRTSSAGGGSPRPYAVPCTQRRKVTTCRTLNQWYGPQGKPWTRIPRQAAGNEPGEIQELLLPSRMSFPTVLDLAKSSDDTFKKQGDRQPVSSIRVRSPHGELSRYHHAYAGERFISPASSSSRSPYPRRKAWRRTHPLEVRRRGIPRNASRHRSAR